MVVGRFNVLAAALLFLGYFAIYVTGLLAYGFAFVFLGLPLIVLVTRLWRAFRGGLEYGLLRDSRRPALRPHVLQAANVFVFLLLSAGLILSAAFDRYSVGMSEGEYRALQILLWAGLVVLAAAALVPRRRAFLATNVLVLLGSVFLAIQLVRLNTAPSDGVVIDLPVRGEWYVFYGGRSELTASAHYVLKAQRDAIDILQLHGRRTYQGDKDTLTSYAAFGEPVLAPADGVVTAAVDGVPDEGVGKTNPQKPLGNYVILAIGNGHYVLMAHLKNGSLRVSTGDQVRRGQQLAQVGNSGQTSEPHLHLQIQNKPEFDLEENSFNKPWYLLTNTVLGLGSTRTYPILLRNVARTRNGDESRPEKAWVRSGDWIRRLDPDGRA